MREASLIDSESSELRFLRSRSITQRLSFYDKTLTKTHEKQNKFFIVLKVLNDMFAH